MPYLKLGVKDNAVGNISGAISASTTTITLATGNGANFPAGQVFIGTLVQYNTPADPTTGIAKSEKVFVTVRSTDTLTVTRGYDGSTATTFLSGDYFYLNVTGKVITDIQDEVTRLESDKLNKGGLRIGLANVWKMFFSNGSNNETELAFGAAGKVLQSNGATSAPTWESPSVDLSGLTEDTAPDMDTDFNLEYDVSGTANKKYKMGSYRATTAEAKAGLITDKFITPQHAKNNYGYSLTFTTLTATGIAATSQVNSTSHQVSKTSHVHCEFLSILGVTGVNHTYGVQTSPDNSSWTTQYTKTVTGQNTREGSFSFMVPADTYVRTFVQTNNPAYYNLEANAYIQE